MTVDEAIQAVASECPNAYAKQYAQAMPEAVAMYGEQGKKTQVLYMLNNMGTWRGERAKAVKATLKAYVK